MEFEAPRCWDRLTTMAPAAIQVPQVVAETINSFCPPGLSVARMGPNIGLHRGASKTPFASFVYYGPDSVLGIMVAIWRIAFSEKVQPVTNINTAPDDEATKSLSNALEILGWSRALDPTEFARSYLMIEQQTLAEAREAMAQAEKTTKRDREGFAELEALMQEINGIVRASGRARDSQTSVSVIKEAFAELAEIKGLILASGRTMNNLSAPQVLRADIDVIAQAYFSAGFGPSPHPLLDVPMPTPGDVAAALDKTRRRGDALHALGWDGTGDPETWAKHHAANCRAKSATDLIDATIEPDPFKPKIGDVYEFGHPFPQRLVIEDAPSSSDFRVRFRIDGGDSSLTSVRAFHLLLAGFRGLRGVGRVIETASPMPDALDLLRGLSAAGWSVEELPDGTYGLTPPVEIKADARVLKQQVARDGSQTQAEIERLMEHERRTVVRVPLGAVVSNDMGGHGDDFQILVEREARMRSACLKVLKPMSDESTLDLVKRLAASLKAMAARLAATERRIAEARGEIAMLRDRDEVSRLDRTTKAAWMQSSPLDCLDASPEIRCWPATGIVIPGSAGPVLTIMPEDGGDVAIVHMEDVAVWLKTYNASVAATKEDEARILCSDCGDLHVRREDCPVERHWTDCPKCFQRNGPDTDDCVAFHCSGCGHDYVPAHGDVMVAEYSCAVVVTVLAVKNRVLIQGQKWTSEDPGFNATSVSLHDDDPRFGLGQQLASSGPQRNMGLGDRKGAWTWRGTIGKMGWMGEWTSAEHLPKQL